MRRGTCLTMRTPLGSGAAARGCAHGRARSTVLRSPCLSCVRLHLADPWPDETTHVWGCARVGRGLLVCQGLPFGGHVHAQGHRWLPRSVAEVLAEGRPLQGRTGRRVATSTSGELRRRSRWAIRASIVHRFRCRRLAFGVMVVLGRRWSATARRAGRNARSHGRFCADIVAMSTEEQAVPHWPLRREAGVVYARRRSCHLRLIGGCDAALKATGQLRYCGTVDKPPAA